MDFIVQYCLKWGSVAIFVFFVFLLYYFHDKIDDKDTWRERYLNFLIIVAFLLWPSQILPTIDAFHCHALTDADEEYKISYLIVDYSIMCRGTDSTKYRTFLPLPICVLFLFVLGFPTIILVLLYRKRRLIMRNDAKTMKLLGFVTIDYKPERYWFEVFDIFRKLTLCGFLGLGLDSNENSESLITYIYKGIYKGSLSQSILGIMLASYSAIIAVCLQPYKKNRSNVFRALNELILVSCYCVAALIQAGFYSTDGGAELVALFIGIACPVITYILYVVVEDCFRSTNSVQGTLVRVSPLSSRHCLYIARALRASSVQNVSEILNALADEEYAFAFDIDTCIEDFYFNSKQPKSVLTGRSLEDVLATSLGGRTVRIQGWSKDHFGCPAIVNEDITNRCWLCLPNTSQIVVPVTSSTTGDRGTLSRIDMTLKLVGSESNDSTGVSATSDSEAMANFLKQFPTHIAAIGDYYFEKEVVEILINFPNQIFNSPNIAHQLIHKVMKRDAANELSDRRSADLIRFLSEVPRCEVISLVCAVLLRVFK